MAGLKYKISIFICEDDPAYLSQITKYVENHISIKNLAMSVVCSTSNPADIIDYLKQAGKEKISGLYFLDLELKSEINGIQLAQQIRDYDPLGCVVFITADADSYKLTFEYKVEALDYITKGDFDLGTRIRRCIESAHDKLTTSTPQQDNFVFKLARDAKGIMGSFKFVQNSIISVPSKDILCFDTSSGKKHLIVLYTADSRFEFRGNISDIESEMDESRFYRCQRTLIVNLGRLRSINASQQNVTFDTGVEIDVAPRQIKKLVERLQVYNEEGID